MNELRGIDIDRIVQGIRIAILDDLIADLQSLKLEVKVINKLDLIKKIKRINGK